MVLSKTQIDKVGDRLKGGQATEEDLRALDEYRRSFADAYEEVIETIRARFEVRLTGRPAKSTASIVDKLRRESVRLSQIQDIAGCRMVVGDVIRQNHAVERLASVFPGVGVVDRRAKPSHNYRAVHVIAFVAARPVEIQVRSELQHKWAELSEKLSDAVDAAIKYGGGQDVFRELLTSYANVIAEIEAKELEIELVDSEHRNRLRMRIERSKTMMDRFLSDMIVATESLKSQGQKE